MTIPRLSKAERAELLKLKPIETAQFVYRMIGHDENAFALHLWEHMFDGFVVASPRCFVMARAVLLDDGRMAWLISNAVGRLGELLKLCPLPLPFIAFNRWGREKLSVLPFNRVEKLAEKIIWAAQP